MANLPTDLLWHEGMLLLPQHFQQQANRQDMVTHWRVGSISPNAWGITELSLDEASIIHGLFRIERMEAVMPDGFIVQYPGEGQGSLEVDLTILKDELRAAPGGVFLALPKLSNGAAGTQGELPRFTAYQGSPVADAHTGDNEVLIERCSPNLSLIVGSEPSDQFTSLKIAEVTCRDEAYNVTTYFPPTLRLQSSSWLGQRLSDLSRRMREKTVFLQQRIFGLIAEGSEIQAADARDKLYAVSCNLPELEMLVATSTAHPFQIYTLLMRLTGSLSIMHQNLIPPTPKQYDHSNMGPTFDDVINFCNTCLDAIQERYQTVALDEIDTGFSLRGSENLNLKTLIIGLRLRPSQSEEDGVKWMSSAIITSAARVGDMIERRIRGATRQRVEREASMELLQSKEVILFAIELTEDDIQDNTELHIINVLPNMGEIKPLELTLFTMNSN